MQADLSRKSQGDGTKCGAVASECPSYNSGASFAQAKEKQRKRMKGKLLSLSFIYFVESGLFKGL
jgi:hypothetical protein